MNEQSRLAPHDEHDNHDEHDKHDKHGRQHNDDAVPRRACGGVSATPGGTGRARRRSRPHASAGAGARLLTRLTAVATGLLLTSCGSTSADSPETTEVTIGVAGNIFDMPIRVADANGYFGKQGLTVTFVRLTASTGTSALGSGSVEFLNDSPTDFLAAIDKQIPETAIAADGGGNPLGLIVTKKFARAHRLTAASSAAEVAKALDGSTGGTSSANTKGEARLFLKAHDVDPGKVEWVSLPSPAADEAALTAGRIDWFVTSQPTPLEIQEAGDGVVVADSVKVPQWSAAQAGYGQIVVCRDSYLAEHAGIARKVATAVQQGAAYMNAHLDSTQVRTVARTALPGVPDGVLRASLHQVEWPSSARMKISEWTRTWSFINSLGAVTVRAQASADDWTNEYLP
jgi:NitT/TauT family transport system substrate-binding protein